LPRIFVPGADPAGRIELPGAEVDKLRKVLRLSAGAEIAILPDDGSVIRCVFDGRGAMPVEVSVPLVEPPLRVTLAQALPKGDKLDEIVRACTGLGVSEFVVFPSERSVMRWEPAKRAGRLERLRAIARESSEVSFRTRVPTVRWADSLEQVLAAAPDAQVLSEVEGTPRRLSVNQGEIVLVVGPEGGWSSAEITKIGDRAVTLGPRVLRVEHAGAAAAALVLLDRQVDLSN
jgi:16S rRNA (uracil1498-N3)-methyltransferase